MGVVHHGHEKIRGGNHTGAVVKLPHRGIIARLGADQQLRERLSRRLTAEQLLQNGGGKLAAAAATMRKAGKTQI